jgi:DnaJ family protein C protein 9
VLTLCTNHSADKAKPEDKDRANKDFQKLAFAYAVLSDERRRARYDATGNTAETLDLENDDFNWGDFFRTQFFEQITNKKISDFAKAYKGSDEEKKDVLEAYTKVKGNMTKLYQVVMLSDMLEDEDRFVGYIDAAIKAREVESYKAYVDESKFDYDKRMRRAETEARLEKERFEKAEAEAKKKGKKTGKGVAGGSDADLAALIQNKNKERGAAFLEALEAKHAPKGKKRKADDGPDEAAFQAMAQRMESSKKQKGKEMEGGDDAELDDDAVDLEMSDYEDEDGEEEVEEEDDDEDGDVASQPPKKRTKTTTAAAKGKGKGKAAPKRKGKVAPKGRKKAS